MRRLTLACLLVAATSAGAAEAPRGYYRFPAIHGDTVVFTAEGDLWKVPSSGGLAQRLTSHLGQETHAAISPDGLQVAFTAAYEGPTELYVMPLAGGLPRRLTFSGERITWVGWTPGGKVLYSTRAFSTLPSDQLVTVDPISAAKERVPLAEAADGGFASDGSLFFTRLPFQGSHTAHYHGGTAQAIWKLGTGATEAVPLTADWTGTSKLPMPWQGRVYFVSDRDGTENLWSMDEQGKDLRQHTHHRGWNVAAPSLAQGRIAYQLGADLHLYDIAADRDAELDIRLSSDLDQLRERFLDTPMDYLTAAHLAPDGGRVALTARGQVFVAPVGQGRLTETGRSPGVRYRNARFAPDGRSVVALSDASGEVEFWRAAANGVGAPSRLTSEGKVLRWDGVLSPDGTLLASTDKDHNLWLHAVAGGKATLVAHSDIDDLSDLAWSPDSAWLAFVMPAANTFQQVKLYQVASGRTLDLTSARTESYSPAWSPDGKWIYFLSDRNLTSSVGSPWGPRQPEPFLGAPTKIFAVALRSGVRFPFQPADELMPKEPEKAKDGEASTKDKPAGASKPATVAVDETGLASRLFEVPAPAGRLGSLSASDTRLFWVASEPSEDGKSTLYSLEIGPKDPKPKALVAAVKSYELSADGKKLLVRKDNDLFVTDASAGEKADLSEKKVDLAQWRVLLDPREELRQMYAEAWRLERDYFWDRGMSGLDWNAIRTKYRPLADRVTDRSELADALGQMISELGVLHMFVYGGDLRKGRENVEPASLGAELDRDQAAGGLRVRHIYRADPDYPGELSPLARPGVEVREGDVITAINGTPALVAPEAGALLRGQADRQVLLHVKGLPGGGERDVIVTPLSRDDAADLRYADWELSRRERVETLGRGQIGYLHLRAMGGEDWTEFVRGFYPVFDRAGLIIDARHNRGGNIDSWVLEKLMRRAWFFWQPRLGAPSWAMQQAFRGHMVVLVDQNTASDGEVLAEGFRRLGLGKVIGMRTWGGEIWLSSSNVLVDKGIATAAELGVYGPEGKWLIEGHGVEPDLVVDNLPAATFGGADAQLDAAVKHLQELIQAHPVTVPTPPPYPDVTKRR
jgi:tricorn protease